MKKRLRIAASVFFVVVTLALIVLWVRSYTWRDEAGVVYGSVNVRLALIQSHPGSLAIGIHSEGSGGTFAYDHYAKIVNTKRRTSPPESDMWSIFGKFDFVKDPLAREIYLPFCGMLVVTGSLGVLSWKLDWQFSLRTMFIATTLFAVVLGLGAWLAS